MDWVKYWIKRLLIFAERLILSAKTLVLFARVLIRTTVEDQRVAVAVLNAMHFDQLATTDPDRWAAEIRDEMDAAGEELRAAQLTRRAGEAAA